MDIIDNVEEAIETCKIQVLCLLPFFGILLLKLPTRKDNSVPTLATNYKEILYNENYIKTLKPSELAWALVHETMHVAQKHKKRQQNRDKLKFNYAADYAIHDVMIEYIKAVEDHEYNIGRERKLKVKDIISMNKDWLYDEKYFNMSAEQIYDTLKDDKIFSKVKGIQFDSHDEWENSDNGTQAESGSEDYEEVEWDAFIAAALEKAKEKLAGNLPANLERLLNSLTKPLVNWRDLLQNFLQFEVYDYSFNPPDRRNQSECILPDFNEMDANVLKNIIFYIDTSGSINNIILNKFYSEITGIMNFFSYIKGYLGFFDSKAYQLTPFENVSDILAIKPVGGGGTSFHAPFEYINENFKEEVTAIVILTDGYCGYPPESIANGTPVLWLYSEEQDNPPPFGVWTVID